MKNSNNLNILLQGKFTEEEYAAWNLWCKENEMLSNGVGYFSLLMSGEPHKDKETKADPRKAHGERQMRSLPLMTALYRFAFDMGLSRALNLIMLQATAVDRQKSPVLQGRLLSMAVKFAQIDDRPLHLLWFICRYEEWLGEEDYRAMIGEPELGNATGDKRKELLEAFELQVQVFLEVNKTLPELKKNVVAEIIARIKDTQARDFEAEPTANNWWSPTSILMSDFSSMAYWPAKEIEDIFVNADPQEWREFEKFLQTAPEEMMPPHIFHGAARFRQPQYEAIQARDKDEGIRHLRDLLELSTIYVLYRNFCLNHLNKMLLIFICNLEHSISQGLNRGSVVDYVFIKLAFEGRVPTILGLWALDVMRQVMHLVGPPEVYGTEIAWIHEQENKLTKRLAIGDFMSED